jgi:hypothetical protein
MAVHSDACTHETMLLHEVKQLLQAQSEPLGETEEARISACYACCRGQFAHDERMASRLSLSSNSRRWGLPDEMRPILRCQRGPLLGFFRTTP